MATKAYYEAIQTANGFKGRLYKYKEDGNSTLVVWLSNEEYSTENEALDAAVDWAEDHNLEVEPG
jgi:hypothetical protein